MGPGIDGETSEQIERIQADAPANEPAAAVAGDAPATDVPSRKRQKKKTSPWWAHFTEGEKAEDGSYTATCIYCGYVIIQGNQKGTSALKGHIKKGCKKIPREKRFKPDAMQYMLQASTEKVDDQVMWTFNQARSRKGLARMVVAHEYPFNCVNHYFLRVFLKELQPSFIIPSRNTLKADCIRLYEEERELLYDLFGKLDCKFSFTSDLWTCKGKDRGFMSLTCHFIDDQWKMRKRIINFTNLPSPHTGKNISNAIYEKFVLWNLDKRVFCLVLDNATSNDVCIKELLSTSSFQKELPVGGNIFHQRCACHVLNLIVQDGLGVLTNQIANVREAMKYIRNSQSRMEKFNLAISQAKAPKKKPAWDVPTRWNSTFLMLELALELKDAIIRYDTLDPNFEYCPTDGEWDNVHILVEHLRKMFTKWDKYWSTGSALLAIGCILDPRCKMDVVEYYFRELYPFGDAATFIQSLKQVLNALFNEYSESNPTSQSQSTTSSSHSRSAASSSVSNTKAGLKEFLNVRKTSEPIKSELEEYLTQPLDLASMDDDFDILAWWKLKVPKYPIMAKMARDILAVPISTVASESTFSIAGRTLSPVRSSLSDESLEALMCAQDWLRASVTEQGGAFGDVMWSSDEALGDGTICASAASCT
ncbi:hypothetical protein LUZ61_000583 [Rhynchospora tenuis]|uniref:BED-type domain-containing protein n=1 Tax=Rhynchospora tenuis TaxID=198213 RepID=A0AAD5ZFM8_9POAL|nr:hypothetical protein LUZ61_000583 [Rhynchospora tenuis]